MAWYYGTYSCGHEGRVDIVGPTKNRQWIADRKFEKMCPECYEKYLQEQREKANTEAVEKAKEMELPELIGTEKQVAWANTIRQNFIELFGKIDEKYLELAKFKYHHEALEKATLNDVKAIEDYILVNKTDARWFIDNKDAVFKAIAECAKDALKTDKEKIAEKSAIEVKLESTIFPQNAITNVAAEITIKDDKITVFFEKNDKFREIVKSLNFKWENAWIRNINEMTGPAEDRAAELGNKLLNAGFPICILDSKIRNNAVNGVYESECNRWVSVRTKEEYKGWLTIRWYDKSDLYNKARKLPGSKWSNPSVVVKVEHYKEVEEFAELYGFKFTKSACKSIDEYREKLENIEVVAPVKIEEHEIKDGLKEILNSGSDILDDLKD